MTEPNVEIRLMAEADLEAGLRLCRIAGWDQSRQDWELFYRNNPPGCFVALCNGQVVGTVITADYEGRLACVAMLLVHPEYRGRGIGSTLMRTAIAAVNHCPCIQLDATA